LSNPKNGKPGWPADKVKRVALATLIPHARNARVHSDEQVAQIAASIGGTITTEVAASLLMITPPLFLEISKKGWFAPIARNRPNQWRIVNVVQGYVRYLQDRMTFGTLQEMADEFGISQTYLLDLVKEGHLPQGERMALKRQFRFNRYEMRKAFSKYEAGRRAEMMQPATENRVRDARARDLEIKTQMRTRELIPMPDAVFALDTVVGLTRSTFGGAAARISRDIAVQVKADDVIDHCLNSISEGLRKVVATLRAGGDPLPSTAALHS